MQIQSDELKSTIINDKIYSSYLLIDGAQFENLLQEIYGYCENENIFSLFNGTYYETLQSVGPYIIKIDKSSDIIDWYFEYGLDNNAGVILKSNSSFIDVYSHLQSWIEVTTSKYNIIIFRYYDPIVFNEIMQKMNLQEKIKFLGCIRYAYWPVYSPNSERYYFEYFLNMEI